VYWQVTEILHMHMGWLHINYCMRNQNNFTCAELHLTLMCVQEHSWKSQTCVVIPWKFPYEIYVLCVKCNLWQIREHLHTFQTSYVTSKLIKWQNSKNTVHDMALNVSNEVNKSAKMWSNVKYTHLPNAFSVAYISICTHIHLLLRQNVYWGN
jgi:hypothetical protein